MEFWTFGKYYYDFPHLCRVKMVIKHLIKSGERNVVEGLARHMWRNHKQIWWRSEPCRRMLMRTNRVGSNQQYPLGKLALLRMFQCQICSNLLKRLPYALSITSLLSPRLAHTSHSHSKSQIYMKLQQNLTILCQKLQKLDSIEAQQTYILSRLNNIELNISENRRKIEYTDKKVTDIDTSQSFISNQYEGVAKRK